MLSEQRRSEGASTQQDRGDRGAKSGRISHYIRRLQLNGARRSIRRSWKGRTMARLQLCAGDISALSNNISVSARTS